MVLLFFAFPFLKIPSGWSATDRFTAFDLWPTVGDRNFFTVASSQGLYRFQYSFDLSNSYVLRPLDATNPDGTFFRSIVDYYFGQFVSGGIGITDFWQAGFTLPVFTRAKFQVPDRASTAGPENVSKLGDLRLSSKVRLLDSNRYRWGAAVEPFVTVPIGSDDKYLGESTATGGIKAIGDFLLTNRLRLALNMGVEFRGDEVVISNLDFQHRFLSALGLSARLNHGVSVSAEGEANSSLSKFFRDKETTPIEFLGGVQWEVGQTGLKVGIGGGSCAICGAKGAKARGFFNIGYHRQDESYALKENEEEQTRIVTLGGVGGPVLEAYEIYELVDKCPVNVGKYQIGRDDPRCTEVYELQSIADACPDESSFNPKLDNPKCLQIYSLREQDSDGDGVPDFKDRCPTEPGARDEEGCPSKAYLIISPEENQLLTQKINFDFGKATLREDSKVILNAVAGAIHAQPGILLLSIEGHTDDVGTEEQNLALSATRARVVYRYLIDQGINPDRLAHKGFGKKRPLSKEKSAAARAINRRVEFVIKKTVNILGE